MEAADRTRAARKVFRGEVAAGPEEAEHAIEFAQGFQASFWGSRWSRVLVVVVAVFAVARLGVAVAGGETGSVLYPRILAAVVLPLSAAYVFRQHRNIERSLAGNRALLERQGGRDPAG